MGEFWMFAATIGIGLAWLFVAPLVLPTADRAALRVGLWVNGITGAEADRIIEFDQTGKLRK